MLWFSSSIFLESCSMSFFQVDSEDAGITTRRFSFYLLKLHTVICSLLVKSSGKISNQMEHSRSDNSGTKAMLLSDGNIVNSLKVIFLAYSLNIQHVKFLLPILVFTGNHVSHVTCANQNLFNSRTRRWLKNLKAHTAVWLYTVDQ